MPPNLIRESKTASETASKLLRCPAETATFCRCVEVYFAANLYRVVVYPPKTKSSLVAVLSLETLKLLSRVRQFGSSLRGSLVEISAKLPLAVLV